MDGDRDRNPHWSNRLSSQSPDEEQNKGEHEQGSQDCEGCVHSLRQRDWSNGSSLRPAGLGLNAHVIKPDSESACKHLNCLFLPLCLVPITRTLVAWFLIDINSKSLESDIRANAERSEKEQITARSYLANSSAKKGWPHVFPSYISLFPAISLPVCLSVCLYRPPDIYG